MRINNLNKFKGRHLLNANVSGFVFLCALILTFFIYQAGLSGGFIYDDIPNITVNSAIAIDHLELNSLHQAAQSGRSGPLGRPLSMLSFAVNHYFSGFDPYYFKLTNLLIHLVNGLAVLVLSRMMLAFYQERYQPDLAESNIYWVSVAIASIWMLHPYNLTSVLYVVQRMNSLSTMFSLWGLVIFFVGRVRLYKGESGVLWILLSVLAFTPLAAFSKENGLLLPVLMLITEISLFSFHTKKIMARRFIISIYLLFVMLPVIAVLSYIAFHPNWLSSGYTNRSFTMIERLMTESRALWFYIRQIILPSVNQMGLYLDDFSISRGLFQPLSTFFSVIGIFLLAAVALLQRKKVPLITFGILFFLVGHSIESTVIPLDIAYEHRNYLPMVGILLPMMFYLLYPVKIKYRLFQQVSVILLIVFFAFATFSRTTDWSNPYDLFESEYRHHPNSIKNNIELANMYRNFPTDNLVDAENFYQQARLYYENVIKLDKNNVKGLLGLISLNGQNKKTIDPEWVKELSIRLKHGLYAPDTGRNLIYLAKCRLLGICVIADEYIVRLFKSVLRNPRLPDTDRKILFINLGKYLSTLKHDDADALDAMYSVVEYFPSDFDLRVRMTNVLIALERFNEARIVIKKTRDLNKKTHDLNRRKKFQNKFAELELKLESAETQAETSQQ